MEVITTKRSGLSQTQKDKLRKARINSQTFDTSFAGEGGPVFLYQACGFNNKNFTEGIELPNGKTGYDNIKWE